MSRSNGRSSETGSAAEAPRPLREVRPTAPAGFRILLTGGAGFIASRLAERLADTNQLILFDRGFDGTPFSYSSITRHPNVRCVEGDIRDAAAVKEAVLEADIVIHLAAMVGVKNVLLQARDTININYLGIANLLAATENHPSLHRLVYFSTSEVFGVNSFRVHEATHTSIGSVNEARWCYSISKLAGEHLVQSYRRDFGLRSVIVRPFNVFGPKRTGDNAMLRFIVNALMGLPLEIHGDGSQIRSWCYIEDFCDGVIATLTQEEAVGEDFNLGNSANTLTIYDLARRVIRLLGSRSEVRFQSIDFSDIDIRVPHTNKAQQLLRFSPRFELEEAIPLAAEWYRSHLPLFTSVLSQPDAPPSTRYQRAPAPPPRPFTLTDLPAPLLAPTRPRLASVWEPPVAR